MVQTVIQPPNPFSFDPDPEKWKNWKSRFIRYLNVTGQSKRPDQEKIDLLIYLMGEEAEGIYSTFAHEPKTFDSAIQAFNQHFNPKKTPYTRKQ